jgi:hypothetical protein
MLGDGRGGGGGGPAHALSPDALAREARPLRCVVLCVKVRGIRSAAVVVLHCLVRGCRNVCAGSAGGHSAREGKCACGCTEVGCCRLVIGSC